MYNLRKIVLVMFTFFVIFGSSISVKAENYASGNYTSLGDSIAFGMSAAQGKGYTDLFYSYLKSLDVNSGMKKYNFGTPGDTSSDLLTKLKSNQDIQASLKNAKVITVCIGGNNLLSPIISAACQAFQVNPDSSELAKDLSDKIKATSDSQSIIQGLLNSSELQNALAAGATQFGMDWPQIISEIRNLAPTADVYAMTIYNPLNSQDPLYNVFDSLLENMNGILPAVSSTGEYKVVDVYTAFKEYKGNEPLVNFNLATGNVDPHPTTKGHEVIYKMYVPKEITTPAAPKIIGITDSSKTISGTAVSGALVTVKADKTYTMTSNGSWSVKLSKFLKVGTKVTASVKKDSKKSKLTTVFVSPKTPEVTQPEPGNSKISGTATKSASIEISIGSKFYSGKVNSNGKFSVGVPALKKGATVKVYSKIGKYKSKTVSKKVEKLSPDKIKYEGNWSGDGISFTVKNGVINYLSFSICFSNQGYTTTYFYYNLNIKNGEFYEKRSENYPQTGYYSLSGKFISGSKLQITFTKSSMTPNTIKYNLTKKS